MITKEHLEHWIKELQNAINGILQEVALDKVVPSEGVKLNNGKYVSFSYLLEKAKRLQGTIGCIEFDILKDGTSVQDDLKEQLDNIDKDELIDYIVKNYFDEVKERIAQEMTG